MVGRDDPSTQPPCFILISAGSASLLRLSRAVKMPPFGGAVGATTCTLVDDHRVHRKQAQVRHRVSGSQLGMQERNVGILTDETNGFTGAGRVGPKSNGTVVIDHMRKYEFLTIHDNRIYEGALNDDIFSQVQVTPTYEDSPHLNEDTLQKSGDSRGPCLVLSQRDVIASSGLPFDIPSPPSSISPQAVTGIRCAPRTNPSFATATASAKSSLSNSFFRNNERPTSCSAGALADFLTSTLCVSYCTRASDDTPAHFKRVTSFWEPTSKGNGFCFEEDDSTSKRVSPSFSSSRSDCRIRQFPSTPGNGSSQATLTGNRRSKHMNTNSDSFQAQHVKKVVYYPVARYPANLNSPELVERRRKSLRKHLTFRPVCE